MTLLTTIAAFLITLGILIVVHEYGHYWVARKCGVKVLRFSIGFGRPLKRWVRGADKTEWVIAAMPLGGYVRMLDERDPDCAPIAPADLPRSFNRQSVWKRIAIVIAGPAANLLLAIAVYWLLNVVGVMEPQPLLGQPPADTPARAARSRSTRAVRSRKISRATSSAVWGSSRTAVRRAWAESPKAAPPRARACWWATASSRWKGSRSVRRGP
jgi:regulator of sigma E protease